MHHNIAHTARLMEGESCAGRVRVHRPAMLLHEPRGRNPDRGPPGWSKCRPSEGSGLAMQSAASRLPIARSRLPSACTPPRAFAYTIRTTQPSWKDQLPDFAQQAVFRRWSKPQTARDNHDKGIGRAGVPMACRSRCMTFFAERRCRRLRPSLLLHRAV